MMLLYEDAVNEAKFAFKGLTGKIKIGILSGLKINAFLPDYLDFMEKIIRTLRLFFCGSVLLN